MRSETRFVWCAIIVGLVAAIHAEGERPGCCNLPKVHGPYIGSFQRWYYSQTTSTCKEFIFGGCQGNENRFDTEKECRKTCVDPFKKLEVASEETDELKKVVRRQGDLCPPIC